MSLLYTQHALQRMAKRQIEAAWVERTIVSPERTEPDEYDPTLEHLLSVVPEVANRVLRVIVSKAQPRRVISVYLDRRMKGTL